MGLFLSSGCFVGFADRSLFGAGKPFFVRRLRSGSRSARKGSRDRNASAAWRRAALASLVFRSALTPEHAEGRWTAMGFSSKLRRLTAPVFVMIRGELAIGAHLR